MVRIRMVAAAVAATLVPTLVLAQASAPMGAERPTTGTPGKTSMTTKEKRKAETMEARKKGELVPAGGGGPAPSK